MEATYIQIGCDGSPLIRMRGHTPVWLCTEFVAEWMVGAGGYDCGRVY